MSPPVTPETRLSELQRIAHVPVRTADAFAQMIRAAGQSLRVEGYDVSERDLREAANHVFSRR
jgi:hypothetical protein